MTHEDALPPAACAMWCLLRNGTWLVRLRGFPVVPSREVAGGSGQQLPEVRERLSTGGAQAAVVPDCDAARWQDRREEASDACFCGKRAAWPLVAFALLDAAGDVPVCKRFDAVGGDRTAPDGGGEGGDDRAAGASWFTGGDPWLAPDVGGHVTEQVGVGEFLRELPLEDFRQSAHRHQPVRITGEEPARTIWR